MKRGTKIILGISLFSFSLFLLKKALDFKNLDLSNLFDEADFLS